ncbi:MAG: hypothetical protein Q9192_003537 [Flavoplaca navasiana]
MVRIWKALLQFLDIPSVRRLYGLCVKAQHHDDDNLFARSSHITGLRFECSSIGSSFLENLFRSVEALEDFYYEHIHFLNDMVIYYGRSVICTLGEHTRKTLQTLTYLDIDCKPARDDVCDSFYLPSLHDFAVLKHVAIEYVLLRVERGFDCDQDDGVKMYRLVDVMPPTLETLELHGPISKAEVIFMFYSLRERSREQLSKLCKILMQRDVDLDQIIRNECKEPEIELAVVEPLRKKHPHPDHTRG